MARGVIAFTVYDALWEQKNKAGQTPIDVASPRIRKDLLLISMSNPVVPDHHKILRAIQNELGEHLMSRVHWLGGTSCGGITSLALGLEQTRRLFLSGRQLAFCGNTRVLPKHNSSGIEDMLKVSFGSHTAMGQLKAQKYKYLLKFFCRVLVTAAKIRSAPPQLVLFRSYAPRITPKEYEKYGYMNPDKILMWKAARATSAAPIFFESYHGLADGAIFCNNPCLTLMTDFFRLQRLENHKNIVS
uniref:PNPLA domain-containing protein n=1 Tax=Angiostrongylus cantonensis TaxID=6313 RepID=A0A0K0CY03_ANGCA